MERLSYKGGCGVCQHVRISRRLKEELAWAIDERLQLISRQYA